jgi:uncharacterized protein YecT (DUF1311 family)
VITAGPRMPAALLAFGVALASAGAPHEALGQPAAGCENARSTAAMRECEVARLKRAEEGMNAAYRGLGARLDASGQAKLRAAQEAWLRFRTAEAGFQADEARNGSLAPLIADSVRADLTEARRKELEKALERYK